MKAADVHPAGYPTVVAVENMGKKIEAATGGKIKFQMFPGSVLGGEKEMIEQTQVGAIQILRTSLGPIGTVTPEVNVFNMPFVFRDIKHMRAVIDGPIGQELLDKVSASSNRLIGLAWMDGGSRSLYTKKPVHSMADLKGQKIRMMGNPLFVDTMNAMGGNGISMGYGEVFTALQTGVIDGAENNPPSLFTANHFKAGAKYYTQTNHLIIPEILVMSKVAWDKLSKEDQALFKKTAREAQMEQRVLWDKAVADYTAKLKAEGVEFIQHRHQAVLRCHRTGARQVRRAVRRPDDAHRRRQVSAVSGSGGVFRRCPSSSDRRPEQACRPASARLHAPYRAAAARRAVRRSPNPLQRGTHLGQLFHPGHGQALPGLHLDRRHGDLLHVADHSVGRVHALRAGHRLGVARADRDPADDVVHLHRRCGRLPSRRAHRGGDADRAAAAVAAAQRRGAGAPADVAGQRLRRVLRHAAVHRDDEPVDQRTALAAGRRDLRRDPDRQRDHDSCSCSNT